MLGFFFVSEKIDDSHGCGLDLLQSDIGNQSPRVPNCSGLSALEDNVRRAGKHPKTRPRELSASRCRMETKHNTHKRNKHKQINTDLNLERKQLPQLPSAPRHPPFKPQWGVSLQHTPVLESKGVFQG